MPFTPDVWGPAFWTVIHIVAYYLDHLYVNNPEETKRKWTNFLNSITDVVPCSKCEFHFKKFQKDNPVPMQSNGRSNPQFLIWTVKAHNAVRSRNGKFVPDAQDVVKAYQDGHLYELPSNVSLTKSMSFDPCHTVQSQLVSWKIGFGIACMTCVVILIVFFIYIKKNKKRK